MEVECLVCQKTVGFLQTVDSGDGKGRVCTSCAKPLFQEVQKGDGKTEEPDLSNLSSALFIIGASVVIVP